MLLVSPLNTPFIEGSDSTFLSDWIGMIGLESDLIDLWSEGLDLEKFNCRCSVSLSVRNRHVFELVILFVPFPCLTLLIFL